MKPEAVAGRSIKIFEARTPASRTNYLHYRTPTKLQVRESNVFTEVCHSVGGAMFPVMPPGVTSKEDGYVSSDAHQVSLAEGLGMSRGWSCVQRGVGVCREGVGACPWGVGMSRGGGGMSGVVGVGILWDLDTQPHRY